MCAVSTYAPASASPTPSATSGSPPQTFNGPTPPAAAGPPPATLAGEFEPLPDLVAELTRSLAARGEITDAASPTLSSLRRNARIAHDRLNARLEEIIHSSQYRDVIQEPLITLRDGRYVIPVKADQRGKIRGIVHDISASGATVVPHPPAVRALGNSWPAPHLALDGGDGGVRAREGAGALLALPGRCHALRPGRGFLHQGRGRRSPQCGGHRSQCP